MLEEIENLARRLEQQLVTYAKLHADEMNRFQEQFDAFQSIQADELQMLRQELAQLKQEIAEVKESVTQSMPAEGAPVSTEPTLTRRDLLTGKMPPLKPKQR